MSMEISFYAEHVLRLAEQETNKLRKQIITCSPSNAIVNLLEMRMNAFSKIESRTINSVLKILNYKLI
jgi:hypothetical protein